MSTGYVVTESAVPEARTDGDTAATKVTIGAAEGTFRYLVNQDAGCLDVTQFVGIVEPCRAPDHSHSYDEVGYIVEGRGLAHFKDGRTVEIGPGSCFHLPPEQIHCIENVGPDVMRIMGVFHPSGDPASRAYDEATQSKEEA